MLESSSQEATDAVDHPPLAFRIRSADQMVQIDDERGGVQIGPSLRVWTDSEISGQVVSRDGVSEYVIPLDLATGKSTLTLHYAW